MRRLALLTTAAAVLLPVGGGSAQDATPGAAASGPNVVVVMTDDQRFDDMPALPKTQRLIGEAGVTFTRYFASYPVCCPARATFLTGQYAHNHKVRCLYPSCGGGYGDAEPAASTCRCGSRDAGYVTAHVGKFLNGYGKERAPDVPNGWTEWFGLVDPWTYRMWGYELFENGDRRTYGSLLREVPRYYQTKVLTNKATQFIRRRAGRRRAVLPLGRVPRAAPRVGQDAGAHRKARAPGAARSRALRAHAAPEAAELQRGHLGQAAVGRAQPCHQLAARGGDPQADARALGVAAGGGPRSRGDHRSAPRHRRARQHVRDLHLRPRLHAGGAPDTAGQDGAVRPLDAGPAADPRAGDPARPQPRRRSSATWTSPPTIMDATPARPSHPLDGRSILPFARNVSLRSFRPFLHTTAGQGAKGRTNTREGGTRGDAAARARLERRAHDPLALRRVQERPAGDVRPEAGPLAAQQRDRRSAHGCRASAEARCDESSATWSAAADGHAMSRPR